MSAIFQYEIFRQVLDQAPKPIDRRLDSDRKVAQWTASPRTEQGPSKPLAVGFESHPSQ
jgi:hypothetical protein